MPTIGDDWDEIDEASWESFPASDPPAWNARLKDTPPPPRGWRAWVARRLRKLTSRAGFAR